MFEVGAHSRWNYAPDMRRPLLLNGFMATGKSTVGRSLAKLAGHPFVDLDDEITERAGASIPDIFARHGEAEFRRLEREALRRVLERARADGSSHPVVALGGGALARREDRLQALDTCIVITLTAPAAELATRASATSNRPLFQGADIATTVEQLLETRRLAYAEAHAVLDTGALDPETAAARALEIWRRDPVVVAAGERSYRVEVGRGIVDLLLPSALDGASRTLLVSDGPVHGVHGARLKGLLRRLDPGAAEVVLETGEQHKNLGGLERIWQAAFDANLDRKSQLLALGGGVVTDMTGFAAATWMRGIRWVGVPTTLLAMVDASVGGKTAVDFHSAKNCIGAFWQPDTVLCDMELEATEPARGYTSSLAEVVKTALIGDPELLSLLQRSLRAVRMRDSGVVEELVRRSVRVKARVVGRDERERGERATLNLGHTLGHALEATGNYTEYTHGEAVSLGLVLALRIGCELGHTPPSLCDEVVALLADVGLPVEVDAARVEAATQLLGHDKKRTGDRVKFVVARAPGRVDVLDLKVQELKRLASRIAATTSG
jgi:shikimate kinase/3-dehydroquinate synthase